MNWFRFVISSSNVGYWISPKGEIHEVFNSHVSTGDELVLKYKLAKQVKAYDSYNILFDNNFVRIISRQYQYTIDAEAIPNNNQIKSILSLINKDRPYEIQVIIGKNKSITIDGSNLNLIEKSLKGQYNPNKSNIYNIRNSPSFLESKE